MGDVRDKDRSGIQDSKRPIEDSRGVHRRRQVKGEDTGGVQRKECTTQDCRKGQMKRQGSI